MRIIISIFFSLLLLCSTGSHAQDIDSLEKEFARATMAGAKCRILFGMGSWYDAHDRFDSSLICFSRCARMARKEGLDSLFMEAKALEGYAVFAANRFEEALPHYDTACAYARRLQLPARLSRYLVMECRIYLTLSKPAEMRPLMREALDAALATHDKAQEAVVYRVLSNYYFLQNNYAGELDYATRSLQIYDSLKMYMWVATAYKQISINYCRQERFRESLQYALRADSVFKMLNDSYDRNILKMHLAIVYDELGDHKRAVRLGQECLDSLANDAFAMRIIYSNLAVAQSNDGAFMQARASFARALELNAPFKIADFDIKVYKQLSKAFLKTGQKDSALYYAKLSESMARKAGTNITVYMECVQQLRDVYEAQNDMALAHAYDKQYITLQDSMYRGVLESSLADAEARFNLSEKNKEITVLSEENELQRLKAQKQTLLNVFLLVVLALGAVIVVLMVTAYRRTLQKNKQLSQQKEQLEAQQAELQEQKNIIDAQVVQLAGAAKMKSRFLANISHELRTPVTLLNGMLEILSGKRPGGETKEQERLNIAYNNSRKLHQMVEEILDLTRLEHNRSQPTFETVKLAPLLKRIVYAFETLVEKEHLRLEYDDAPADGVYLSVDVSRFEKVMNNLLYNAIKFNHSGGYIRVAVYPLAGGSKIQIDVADNGIGIAEADLPHIFEHFYQGETLGLKAAGAGIGLSLVREFTMLMGGDVQVKSKKGAGTTFSLQFDIVSAPEVAELQDAVIYETPDEAWERFGARPKLLVVEDNAEMRYYLADILGEKADVAAAGNGHEGLAWLQHNIPDLIISDVMMPGMDGREFITQLKSDERYRKIPVITLTALSDKDSELSFLRLGVDDYIVKPFNADELRIRVYNLLVNLAERRSFTQEPAEPGDEDVAPPGSADAEEFRGKITAYVLSRINDMNLSVDDLAATLFLSKRQLYRMSKSLTGFTPAQLIKEIRLQRAYELLVQGNITKLEDVCNRVGYEKTSYFAQQFYERFGKRPTDFF